jgi:glycine betaine transporter
VRFTQALEGDGRRISSEGEATVQSRQRDNSEVGIVFWVSAAFALAFILWGVIAPENFGAVTQTIFDWIVTNLGWFYLLAGNFFLAFVVILALSRYGKMRLGKEGERLEFGRFAWFAMMFQAGMGPALSFWGVAEPLAHYSGPASAATRPCEGRSRTTR